MKSLVQDRVLRIENYFSENWNGIKRLSLFSGLAGLPVFYFMLFKLTKKQKYIRAIHEIIEHIFEKLNSEKYSFSYCNGFVGVAFMLNFLEHNKILESYDLNESLSFMDNTIADYTLKNLKTRDDIDFLHGALGAAHYLNERVLDNSKIEDKTIRIFHKLANIITEDIKLTEEVSSIKEFNENLHKTNCGLAHGHISNIIIFSKFLENFSKDDKVKDALIKSINCILSFESDQESSLSAFPGIAINKYIANYNIHLGWCYGDQTISIGLFRAAKALKDNELLLKSKEIAYRTLKRNSFEKALKSPLSDAGFCHGASSLAYLHKKWYIISGDKKFYNLYMSFMKDVLRKGQNKDGIAGYKKYLGDNEFEDAIGFLDGAIGIGIVLIDYLLFEKGDAGVNWDSFFLLE